MRIFIKFSAPQDAITNVTLTLEKRARGGGGSDVFNARALMQVRKLNFAFRIDRCYARTRRIILLLNNKNARTRESEGNYVRFVYTSVFVRSDAALF